MAALPAPKRRLSHDDYTAAWISPLKVERIAALAMLDEEHESLWQLPGDQNFYTLGRIGNHNIVIAGMHRAGNVPAATVVSQMTMTFHNIRYGLLVGIGGGVPFGVGRDPVRLGHVVVGTPFGTSSGTIQYDSGKALTGGYERTGVLAPPPTVLIGAAQELQVRRDMGNDDPVWMDTLRIRSDRARLRHFAYPGAANDHLYDANYEHPEKGKTCHECGCDPARRIPAPPAGTDNNNDGTIASGSVVIKEAMLRDRLAQQHNVLCFEMEAAGVLPSLPCLVIRGISDYCDSHKNDAWHGFAAATAAAYARQLFFYLPYVHSGSDPYVMSIRTKPIIGPLHERPSPVPMAKSAPPLNSLSWEAAAENDQLSLPQSETPTPDEIARQPDARLLPLSKAALVISEDLSTIIAAKEAQWYHFYSLRKYNDAELLGRQMVEIREKMNGPKHAETIHARHLHARVLYDLKQYDEAEARLSEIDNKNSEMLILQAALLISQVKFSDAANLLEQISERDEHTYSADTLFLLVKVYNQLYIYSDRSDILRKFALWFRERSEREKEDSVEAGYRFGIALYLLDEYQEAEERLRKVSELYSTQRGDRDQTSLDALQFVGQTLLLWEKFEEAKGVFSYVVNRRTETLGPMDERTLSSLHLLGMSLIELGEYAEAEPCLRQAADYRSQMLGPLSVSTLSSLDALGELFSQMGRDTEAEVISRRAAEGRAEVLGSMHRATLESLSAVGLAVAHRREYVQAEPILRKVAEGRLQTLGGEHSSTIESYTSLGTVLMRMKEWDEAATTVRFALDGLLRKRGLEHEETLHCMYLFSLILSGQGDLKKAERTFRKLVEVRTRTAGADHRATIRCTYRLGCALKDQDSQSEEAEELMRGLVDKEKSGLPVPQWTRVQLAELLYSRGKLEEAEQCLWEVVASWTASKGAGDAATLEAQELLGKALYKLRKFSRAAEVFEAVTHQREQSLGKEHKLSKYARRRYLQAQDRCN